jgi:CheY-like chemotaxis protein
MEPSKYTVICVDDDQDNLDLIKFMLERKGFEAVTCDTLEECLFQIRQNRFDAIILDNRFGATTSVEICQEIRIYNPHTPIIFYSGESRPAEIEKALKAGGNAYLIKPNDFDKLTETVLQQIQATQARM